MQENQAESLFALYTSSSWLLSRDSSSLDRLELSLESPLDWNNLAWIVAWSSLADKDHYVIPGHSLKEKNIQWNQGCLSDEGKEKQEDEDDEESEWGMKRTRDEKETFSRIKSEDQKQEESQWRRKEKKDG